jgi:hypothetical protein
MTTYKALSNGEGLSGSSAKKSEQTASENLTLGALKLTKDEMAQLEQWTREPSKPTEFMVAAAKAHRALQSKLKR